MLKTQFSDFNLEDKVVSWEGSIVRSNDKEKDKEWKVYYKRKFKKSDACCYGS